FAELGGNCKDLFGLLAVHERVGERGEWRGGHGTGGVHLSRGDAGVVVLTGKLVDVVIGLVGLHENAAGFVAAAGAAADLGEKLEDAFGSTKIWQSHREISANDADERDAMDVVAFGDHLRADEEVDFSGVETLKDALHVAASADGVAV